MRAAIRVMFILSLSSIITFSILGCGRKAAEKDEGKPVQGVSENKEKEGALSDGKTVAVDAHSGHGHEIKKESFNVKELLEKNCECNIKQYLCDECRYELGIVKAGKSLFAPDPKTGKSFLSKIKTDKRKFYTLISATGEVRLNENRTSHVSPRVAGIIKSSEVDIGAKVKEGDVLFTMDSVEVGEAVNGYLNYKFILALELRNLEKIGRAHL